VLAGLGALVTVAGSISGQSISAGSIIGQVLDPAGAPMWEARVVVVDSLSGVQRDMTTPPSGTFRFDLVPPGDYLLVVEKIGYGPVRVLVPVTAGRAVEVPSIRLEIVELPVSEVREVRLSRGTAGATRPGVSEWFSPFSLNEIPGESRDLGGVGRLSTTGDASGAYEGLPSWMNGYSIDGIEFRGGRHVGIREQAFAGMAFPVLAFESAELISNGVDVEWSGVAGTLLKAQSRRGSRHLRVRAFGDWSGDALAHSKYIATIPSANTIRGGAVISGPIVRDTSHFIIGVEARRAETPFPAAWVPAGFDAQVLAVARDSFGVDLTALMNPRVVTSNVVTGFGHFDWRLGNATTLAVRSSVASLSSTDTDLGARRSSSLGSTRDGLDVTANATLTSAFVRDVIQELRIGLESTRRDFESTTPPFTSIATGGMQFGSDPALPGSFRRTRFKVAETLHLPQDAHSLKVGFGLGVNSIDETFAPDRTGSFQFGDVSGFGRGAGGFTQTVGAFPTANHSSFDLFGFFQDSWRAVPGFRLTFGMRWDFTKLPLSDIRLNRDWLSRTGVFNNGTTVSLDSAGGASVNLSTTRHRFSPRFGFTWELGAHHEWTVNGGVGLYYGLADPALFSELIINDGGLERRRGLGMLGAWPAVPDSTVAPVQGMALSVLGPDYEPPRTFRASFGLSRGIGSNASIHAETVYRHTDFLTRRHDLNRAGALRADQHGRPVYGDLQQLGSLVQPTPGSNRRFSGFDVVSALDPDGFSEYWAVTVGVERHFGDAARLSLSYTRSGAQDNWLGVGQGPEAQLTPFPDSLNGVEWEDGTSDFDRPDRFVGALRLAPTDLPVTVTGFYRYESGYPFTPGLPAGVDLNGDGSGVNDPAFIDDAITGVSALFGAWPCLRRQRGRFAERNSCRTDAIHRVDVRVTLELLRHTAYPVSLVIDGLNLVETDRALIDRALYVIDPAGTLTVSPDGQQVDVPLAINPRFGKPQVRRSNGRVFRVGMRVNY